MGSDYTINDLTANYNSISWQKLGGFGSVLNSNTNQPTYQSDVNDSGQVLLIGTLTGDAVCESFTITKTINIIQKLNSIDLGTDQSICSNENQVTLNATLIQVVTLVILLGLQLVMEHSILQILPQLL